MNENKAIALEILKLHREQFEFPNEKEMAEKYNEILEVLDNHSGSKGCIGGPSVVRKLTRIEVVTRALKDAGYVIVDYKSNHNENTDLTGLVIARLKD